MGIAPGITTVGKRTSSFLTTRDEIFDNRTINFRLVWKISKKNTIARVLLSPSPLFSPPVPSSACLMRKESGSDFHAVDHAAPPLR